jgi:hypothetical protein
VITRFLVIMILITAGTTGPSFGNVKTNHEDEITAESALRAINIFQVDPLGEQAKEASARVVRFAQASDAVTITVASKYVPWIDSGKEVENSHILLGAYIAGNLKFQLEKGVNKNQPYQGILQVISTYKQLLKANAIEKIDAIEKWIGLQRTGKLRQHIESL